MSRQPNRSRVLTVAVCVLLVVIGISVALQRHRQQPRTDPSNATGFKSSPQQGATNDFQNAFAQAADKLRAGASFASGRQTLGELKARLAAEPKAEVSAAIRAELKKGSDIRSGLDFKVGTGGALSEWPSMRVFLLDQLAQIDPAAAAEVAREILASSKSPEEWALALRDCARVSNDAATRDFLESKMRELLTHEPWQQEASAGFLEAFDVAVYLRGTKLLPELTTLVRKTDNRAVARAAYLALDRLTIADPALILEKLADDPQLMQGREVTRANYFARADAGDATQRAVLERYLLDPRRTPEELQTFTGLYPNANYMVSPNLLTTVITPTRADLDRLDQAALRTLNEWLADARFAPLHSQLDKTRSRVQRLLKPGG